MKVLHFNIACAIQYHQLLRIVSGISYRFLIYTELIVGIFNPFIIKNETKDFYFILHTNSKNGLQVRVLL